MQRAKIIITIYSYWHSGSGFGEGANLDALVVKTAAGLPYLPGKSLKGVLREACMTAEEFNQLEAGITARLFGTITDVASHISRFDAVPGTLSFSNAVIEEMEEWASANRDKLNGLFSSIASTSIGNDGIATDETLRRIEVSAPLELTAVVEADEQDRRWLDALKIAAPLVRGIGAKRNRGFGRCKLEVMP